MIAIRRVVLTTLPVTEISFPLKDVKSLKGTHAAGNCTIRLSGTVTEYPLTEMVPPELNSEDFADALEEVRDVRRIEVERLDGSTYQVCRPERKV